MAMSHGCQLFHHPVAVVVLFALLLHHAAAVAPDRHLPRDAAPSNSTTSLPPPSTALTMGSRDAPSSSSTAAHFGDVADFSDHLRAPASPPTVARRLLASPSASAAAPSPRAAPSPTRRGHARSATRTPQPYYGVTFADLHDACARQSCRADYFHRLATVLYGPPRTGDEDYNYYCVVRSIEGSAPILPGSWRAAVATGGDVCYVEVARMDGDSFRIHCWAWTCSRRCTTYPGEALSFAIDAISTPCGGVTTSGGVPRSAAPSLLVNAALPLLAVAFLPRPLAAAAVVLAYLPSLVRAGVFQEELMKLNHATCAVYPYNNTTGAVERARPVPRLREMCLRPLCFAFDGDADEGLLSVANVNAAWHGRWNDPLRIFCAVDSLEGASSPSIFFPWRNTWRGHLPISDPDAAAASGVDVCYVELAHMDYTEGTTSAAPPVTAAPACPARSSQRRRWRRPCGSIGSSPTLTPSAPGVSGTCTAPPRR